MSRFCCLALETGVRPPSVAACNGDRHFQAALPSGRKVAAALFDTIDEVLDEVGLSLEDLDCIAFGRGPGAFTGLRVAAGAAQGLGTGLGIELCAVSSLAALAQNAYERAVESAGSAAPGEGVHLAGARIAPALPAGREQVYLGWYQADSSGLVSPRAEDGMASATACRVPGSESFIAAGRGWDENSALNAAHSSRVLGRQEDAFPQACTILRLAHREYTENRLLRPEDAQPVYLRSAV